MDIKIGKSVLIKLLLVCVLVPFLIEASPRITLRALTTQRTALEQSYVGLPFMLEVTVEDAPNITNQPTIDGLEKLTIVSTSKEIAMSIGNRSVHERKVYLYVVSCPHEGNLTLGPARLETPQGVLQSNILNLMVSPYEQQVHQAKLPLVYAEIAIDDQTAVVGQKIRCSARFASADSAVELQHVTALNVPQALVISNGNHKTFSEKKADMTYKIHEWQIELYFKEPGTFTIPPLTAHYNRHIGPIMPAGFFGQLTNFLGATTQEQQAYSNSIPITIEPLPAYAEPISAVGDFKEVTLSVNQTTVSQGEAFVVTLAISGSGNFEYMAAPRLKLPNAYTYYDSKATLEGTDPQQVKRYEYIVQALQAGTWELPAQEFTYFDVATRSYKTLMTTPLTITVNASALGSRLNSESKWHAQPGEADQEETQKQFDKSSPAAILEHIHPSPLWSLRMSFKFFIILVIVPLLMMFAQSSVAMWSQYQRKHGYPWRRRRGLRMARSLLKQAERERNAQHIYAAFKHVSTLTLDSTRDNTRKNTHELLEFSDGITQYLREQQCSVEFCREWEAFWYKLLSHIFAQSPVESLDSLIREARIWINHFEQLMRVMYQERQVVRKL